MALATYETTSLRAGHCQRDVRVRICWEPFGGPFHNAWDLSMNVDIEAIRA